MEGRAVLYWWHARTSHQHSLWYMAWGGETTHCLLMVKFSLSQSALTLASAHHQTLPSPYTISLLLTLTSWRSPILGRHTER